MADTEHAEYTFTVKEGPAMAGGEAPTYLMCEPRTQELSIVGSGNFLTIELMPGTTIERAQEIARFLNANVRGLAVTTF